MKLLPNDPCVSVNRLELDGFEVYDLCRLIGGLMHGQQPNEYDLKTWQYKLESTLQSKGSNWNPQMHFSASSYPVKS